MAASQAGLFTGMALSPALLAVIPPAAVIARYAALMVVMGVDGLRRFEPGSHKAMG